MPDLSTRAEVAAQLRISERTLRRLLPRVPGLVQIKAGRLVLFDARNVDRIMEALQCPCMSASVEKSGTRGVLSVSAAKRSKSPSTAQDAAREAMQKLRQRHEKPASEPTSSLAQKAARKQTVADAILAYLQRPGGVPAYDVDRLADLNERIGDRPISDVAGAWHRWLATRGAEMAPGTAARWRAILQAALGHWAKAHGMCSRQGCRR
jgi:hypothetical protein